MTSEAPQKSKRPVLWIAITIVASLIGLGIGALLVSITRHKTEAETSYVRLVEVGEDDTDAAKWGTNWPMQYDGYKRTAMKTSTKYGGHGGSEAMPEEKLSRDPWLKRMFLGYAFSIDYRDRRGHAYMLADQEATERLSKPQSGSCLHCHASVMPLYRKLGNGDVNAGLDATAKLTYQEASTTLHASAHARPGNCRTSGRCKGCRRNSSTSTSPSRACRASRSTMCRTGSASAAPMSCACSTTRTATSTSAA